MDHLGLSQTQARMEMGDRITWRRNETNRAGEDELLWSETACSEEESSSATGRKSRPFPKRGPLGRKDMVTFISGTSQRKWVEHYSVFADHSAQLRKIFEFDAGMSSDDICGKMKGFTRVASLQYKLTDVSDEDFDSLMWGLKPKLGRVVPLDRLCSILVLATDWGFTDLRQHAMQEIPKQYLVPMKKVALARKTNVTTWTFLRDPYVALCVRLPPVDDTDGDMLGMKTVIAINLARSCILQRRQDLIKGEYPAPWMGTNFWHARCWAQMAAMWREVISQDVSSTPSTSDATEAMKLVLAKRKAVLVDGKPSIPLCKSCDNEVLIVEWLGLSLDSQIAEKVLKKSLAQDLEGL